MHSSVVWNTKRSVNIGVYSHVDWWSELVLFFVFCLNLLLGHCTKPSRMYEAEVQCGKCAPVTEHKFLCSMASEAKQSGMSEFGAEKGVLQGHTRRWVPLPNKSPNSPKAFSKTFWKARWGCRRWLLQTSWRRKILCPLRSGRGVPVTSNKENVVLCSTTFICIWMKSVMPLKARALRMGYLAYFRLEATFLTQREGNRTQRLK